MSQNITCPNCSHEQVVKLVQHIGADDQCLEQLFNGELNQITCEECASSFICETPIVYRDEERGFYVFYNPQLVDYTVDQIEGFMDQVMTQTFAHLEDYDIPECRVTRDRNSFIEKIAIVRSELDDRVLEFMKFQIFQNDKSYSRNEHVLFYDFSHTNQEFLEITVFSKTKGRALDNLQIAQTTYDQLVDMFENQGDALNLEDMFPGYYVQLDRVPLKK